MTNRLLACLMIPLVSLAAAPARPAAAAPPAQTQAEHKSGNDADARQDQPTDKDDKQSSDNDKRRRDHDHWRPPLEGEQIDAAIEILRHIDAAAADRYVKLRKEDPQRAGRELRRWFPRLEHFLAMRRYDPPMYELRIEDFRLAHESHVAAEQLLKARKDEDPKVKDLEQRLRKLVEQHFDIRQKMRERELSRLQERIERLREQLDERTGERQDLIEQRVKELMHEGGETQW